MCWGANSGGGWLAAATADIASGSRHCLGFNEPDLPSQSNLTPEQAVALWQQYMEPLAGKCILISPAVTNGGPPMGVAWLQQFVELCNNCTIDGHAMHWYDQASNIDYFKNYFTDAQNTFKAPIIISEFAGSGTVDEQVQFFNTVCPWLESQSGIIGYAAFGLSDSQPFVQNGGLTQLGQAYKNC